MNRQAKRERLRRVRRVSIDYMRAVRGIGDIYVRMPWDKKRIRDVWRHKK